MQARDFRSIGRAAQEELRRRALVLIEQQGPSQGQAAPVVGVHRQAANIWLKRNRQQGEEGVLDGRRRVSPRRGKGAVGADEADRIRRCIVEQNPDQLGLPFGLWTSQAVRAVIYWGDEAGVSNQGQIGRSYAPKGQTPMVARTAKRIARSMISAVSNRGRMRFMLYQGALTADRFLAFLRRLVRDAGWKVALIVDNRKVHEAGKVQAWVESHAHEIELCYLPPYAPGHNPSECLNNDPKQQQQQLRQRPQPAPKEELIGRTRSVLRAIQRSPQRVRAYIRAYFRPEPVRHAA